jgi:hypothetical protein
VRGRACTGRQRAAPGSGWWVGPGRVVGPGSRGWLEIRRREHRSGRRSISRAAPEMPAGGQSVGSGRCPVGGHSAGRRPSAAGQSVDPEMPGWRSISGSETPDRRSVSGPDNPGRWSVGRIQETPGQRSDRYQLVISSLSAFLQVNHRSLTAYNTGNTSKTHVRVAVHDVQPRAGGRNVSAVAKAGQAGG